MEIEVTLKLLAVLAVSAFVFTFVISFVCLTLYNMGCTVYRTLYTINKHQ